MIENITWQWLKMQLVNSKYPSKASLDWFEMQYPISADEPKTKEAYRKMIASFITEHNTIGSTREQQNMAWKTLNWNPA